MRMLRFQVDLTDMVNAYNRCPTPIVTASRTGLLHIHGHGDCSGEMHSAPSQGRSIH